MKPSPGSSHSGPLRSRGRIPKSGPAAAPGPRRKMKPANGENGRQPEWMKTLCRLFSQTSDGVFALNQEQCIIFWNNACERILGVPSLQALGKPCWQVIGGVDHRGNPICFSHCMVAQTTGHGELVQSFDVRVVRNEVPVWVNVSTLTIRGRRPAAPIIVHLLRETGDPRRLENRIQEFLSRLDNPPLDLQDAPSSNNRPSLTQREKEVLSCLAKGIRTKDMARQLGVSPITIRSHIKHVLAKINAHSQVEAVSYAFRHSLL